MIAIDVRRRVAKDREFRFALNVPASSVTVLFGPSGSGKTSLLRLIAGLDDPDSGTIRFGDDVWFDGVRSTSVQRRRVGFVSQEASLFPHLDVSANVGFGVPAKDRSTRVSEALTLARAEALRNRATTTLSGGERQRVALARAIATKPCLLLLDEPLSALDTPSREELRADLGRFLRAIDIPAILVTHDRTEALATGDRVALIADGAVAQEGPIADVFNRPASESAARIVGVESVVPCRVVSRGGEGLATVDASGVALTAIDPGTGVDHAFACIRADEVILETGSTASSARNRLLATVKALRVDGPLVRIDLDCGFPLAAYITRAASRDLALAHGSIVTAVLKAPAIHLVPRVPA